MHAYHMKAAAISLIATLSVPTAAFWRMPCPGRLVLERIDPIVSPGKVSGHVHTVSGGSGFGFETTYEQQRESACTSCPIKQDFSAYWTPKLYYMGPGGSYFEDVPQAGEGNGATGGLTVYYEQRGNATEKLKAFPPGFRMLAGDPFQRNETGANAAPGKAVSFVCLDYSGVSTQSLAMPNINCPDGLRAQVYFPSCWDGKNNYTDDGAHMAYPIGDDTYDNGWCPDSHPVHLVSIFYEVIYQTNLFADRWHDPHHHPFVFAMGDRTGYGFHGDFVNGWDVEALQTAVDTCTNDSGELSDCPVFADLYSNEQSQACMIPPSVHEPVTGNLTKLPGCNPVTDGPEYAPPPACPATPIGKPETYFTNEVESLGWEYVGCANDSVVTRTFQGASSASDTMTISQCLEYCKSEGYSLAGLEYASQCYCDNKYYDASRKPNPDILGNCVQPCAGNSKEICGGASALSVYKNCHGGACKNVMFHVNGTEVSTGRSHSRRHLHGSGHARRGAQPA